MNNLALQADLWYNKPINNVVAGSACDTPARIHLIRRRIMDSLYLFPPDDNPQKPCTGPCGGVLPATAEYFSRQGSELKSMCKACTKEYYKAYSALPEVRQRIQEHEKEDRANPEFQKRRKERRDLPDVKAHKQKYNKEYRSTPESRERYKALEQNRRARKRAVGGTHTHEQIREQYDRQKSKCYYCIKKIAWGKHHIDHVIPLSRGGSNDISNLVIACQKCNLTKHNRLPHEWPQGGRLF